MKDESKNNIYECKSNPGAPCASPGTHSRSSGSQRTWTAPTSLARPSTAHTSSLVGSGQLHSTPSTIPSGHTLIMTSPIYCIHYSHYGCTFIGSLSLNLHHVLSRLRCFPWSFKFRVNFNRGSTFAGDFAWSLFWETLTLIHSAKHQLLSMTPLCLLNHYVWGNSYQLPHLLTDLRCGLLPAGPQLLFTAPKVIILGKICFRDVSLLIATDNSPVLALTVPINQRFLFQGLLF